MADAAAAAAAADAGGSARSDAAPATPARKFTRPEDKQSPGSSEKKGRRKKPKKWVPPILPRYKRRDTSPGPGAYNLGVYSPTYHKDITHGGLPRASLTQDTRDFYFGANQSKSSAMFGRDSPGPSRGRAPVSRRRPASRARARSSARSWSQPARRARSTCTRTRR
jgi:hypothetical protein